MGNRKPLSGIRKGDTFFVLREINNNAKWTQMNSAEMYKGIIEKCKLKAGSQSLSEWELEVWNREAWWIADPRIRKKYKHERSE